MKLEVPSAVGVPEITIESVMLGDKVKPGGRVPAVCVHVKGPAEPPALTTPKYGTPSAPTGSEVVVIVSTESTVIESPAVMLAFVTDVAVTLTVVFAARLGGALYVTEVLVGLSSVPPPVRLQVTPALLGSLATAAAMAWLCP